MNKILVWWFKKYWEARVYSCGYPIVLKKGRRVVMAGDLLNLGSVLVKEWSFVKTGAGMVYISVELENE